LSLNSQNEGILDFIPECLPKKYLSTSGAFSRNSKLSVKETIAYICTLASGGLNGGIRQHLANFLLNNSKCTTIDASNACRTRYKIRSSAFEQIFSEVVNFVYENWDTSEYQYKSRNVIGVDGSKFTLPASVELQNTFDLKSLNLDNGGRHYPQCLVSTFYDVYRKIPVLRTIQPNTSGDERIELTENLNTLPDRSIILADRGYWGYEVFYHLIENSSHDFVARMPGRKTFKKVIEFAESEKNEEIVTISPPDSFLKKWRKGESKVETPTPITLRLIRYTPPQGTEEIILATTLLDSEKYPLKEITELYWDRWQIELFYRDEKTYVQAGKFHSKKKEGVLQELFASVLMSVVTRYHLYKERIKTKLKNAPQYLSAITTITINLVKFISLPQEESIKYFARVMSIISISKYYKQENRPSKPRVTKSAPNKWKMGRRQKLKQKE